ncbi:MAG: PD-(D/E)XK nuclease family protein [Planctomycetota bacterium]|nr:MAG: PD-(D/E)XK nuclease family protein [Planctomycetota bacterium]
MLAVQHRELAANGYRFSDVLEAGSKLGGFHDADRWQVLDELQQRYLQRLDALGMWDLQTARIVAVEHHECHTDRHVFLLGTVDLNEIVKKMLGQLGDRVTAFVYAPETLADRFDAFGCLVPERWVAEPPQVADDRISYAADAREQIRHVIRILRRHAGQWSEDAITIGVADRELVRELRGELQRVGVATRWGVGPELARTPMYRLLDVMADFLETRSYAAFSALVRHPDVYDWLEAALRGASPVDVGTNASGDAAEDDDGIMEADGADDPVQPVDGNIDPVSGETAETELPQGAISRHPPTWNWLAILDRFAAEHIPAAVELSRLQEIDGVDSDTQAVVAAVVGHVEQWLRPLTEGTASLREWAERLQSVLGVPYRRPLDLRRSDHRVLAESLDIVGSELAAWSVLHDALQLSIDGPSALRLLMRQVAGQELRPDPQQNGIELQGWLDLAWDDAAVTIITSFNDEFVPESLNSHLFLPDALRRAVGLPDNTRRYARDAYFLEAVLQSREAVHLITARRDTRQDPLTPSRLLLTGDAEQIAARLLRFYDRSADEAAGQDVDETAPAAAEPVSDSVFVPHCPTPDEIPPVGSISVTAFRDYLRCPFRFYLKHVLRLRTVDDTAEELDAQAFGTLIHEALRIFGESDLRDACNPKEIAELLDETLHQLVRASFGNPPRVAVALQVERARERLRRFAEWQAQRRSEGWRICHVEFRQHDCDFVADEDAPGGGAQSIRLTGRIDRIDVHEDTGEWALLDYKTGDNARDPERQHRRRGHWVDLQLPLYRHLVRSILPEDAPIQLGYVALSKRESEELLRLAEWEEAELQEADKTARQVVRQILAGRFWPPSPDIPPEEDDFPQICGVGVLS